MPNAFLEETGMSKRDDKQRHLTKRCRKQEVAKYTSDCIACREQEKSHYFIYLLDYCLVDFDTTVSLLEKASVTKRSRKPHDKRLCSGSELQQIMSQYP